MTNPPKTTDLFHARDTFSTGSGPMGIHRLDKLEEAGLAELSRLPYSIRVLLESALRHCDGFEVTEEDVRRLAGWKAVEPARREMPFKPARVVMQDFTGVPAVVDLAAMRSAMARLGGDPGRINPLIPVDLVIDHSVQVDHFGSTEALSANVALEFTRNRQRYELLRWAQEAFENFRVVPPSVGIIHQVNLEMLAPVVRVGRDARGPVAMPDSLVGTDSHTTMINGLGVVGWGVGGIEAEAVMLGQPLSMLTPDVIGFELTGVLPPEATATDLVLTVTQILRAENVVGKFVEYFGPGASAMRLPDRATLANMAPEYGATMGFFPVDERTIDYLRQTGRGDEQIDLIERYTHEQGLFRSADAPTPEYTKVLSLDLSTIEPSLAGPKRPQDRIPLAAMKQAFRKALTAPVSERGFELDEEALGVSTPIERDGRQSMIGHGAVVIASITSCTNTSNPSVMIAAGLLARNAFQRGLSVPPHVKTSLAPGSRVVTEYLNRARLDGPLERLGFHTVGYGCATCIGNSGPLPESVAGAVVDHQLVASAVVSGNRNFEGRVSPLVKANYLASPPLVVAYALAGTTDIDLTREPLGIGSDGQPVHLADIWPTRAEIERVEAESVRPEMFTACYDNVFAASEAFNQIPVAQGELYAWDAASTYIQEPPFLVDLPPEPEPTQPIRGARVLALLGDSVTTDHISPAGSIAPDSPAGRYLRDRGVATDDFNSYGSRRGNDRVMTRGTLANIRIRNRLAPKTEGGLTRHLPDGPVMTIHEAAEKYAADGVPLIVLAGSEYGTGSSRDWAAKGTQLLGVCAVIASSFERIHRGNLVGMGVLPLQFVDGRDVDSLELSGEETFDIADLGDAFAPGVELTVTATAADGTQKRFQVVCRIDTPVELEYYRNGGILQTVLRKLG